MIVNQESLLVAAPIFGMYTQKHRDTDTGLSYGLTECGYDIRIKQNVWLFLGHRFVLASSIEYFRMPQHLRGKVENKSSWARRGLDASMTTNIEPGWAGYLTLELRYAKARPLFIPTGTPIASVIFESLAHPGQYVGPYQNQEDKPVPAIHA